MTARLRPMPSARNFSLRSAPIATNRATPVQRCTIAGASPAGSETCPSTVNAIPNARPLARPSMAPCTVLPLPPGTYEVRTNASPPTPMPIADTSPGRMPFAKSHITGTVANSTDDNGATTPMRATE